MESFWLIVIIIKIYCMTLDTQAYLPLNKLLFIVKRGSWMASNIIFVSSWLDRNRSHKTGQEKNDKRLPDLTGIQAEERGISS